MVHKSGPKARGLHGVGCISSARTAPTPAFISRTGEQFYRSLKKVITFKSCEQFYKERDAFSSPTNSTAISLRLLLVGE